MKDWLLNCGIIDKKKFISFNLFDLSSHKVKLNRIEHLDMKNVNYK